MANKEHLEILKQGLKTWNDWRLKFREITPDLSGADLRGWYLANRDLSAVNLSGVRLNHADLGGATLEGANLHDVTLRGAYLKDTKVGKTIFANMDLREIDGLENLRHLTRSEISISTIHRSKGQIQKAFLRGCGLSDWEIEATNLYREGLSRKQIVDIAYKLIELHSDPLIQFQSCFVSYSSSDDRFATRLYSDLQSSGVRCWFAPEDMKIGDRIRRRIDDSILVHDKLLLILSETSVASQWIEQEVATALAKEREHHSDVLFPIRLDDAVIKSTKDWPALIKNTRHIGDFRRWEDRHEYSKAFKRLINDLRKDSTKTT